MIKRLRQLCFLVSVAVISQPGMSVADAQETPPETLQRTVAEIGSSPAGPSSALDAERAGDQAAGPLAGERPPAERTIEGTSEPIPESTVETADVKQVRPDRLWLPASSGHMRPLLMAAAERALENPECIDVLYGQLNEYRTERDAVAFNILCLHDARTTFNLIYLASELEAEDNAASAAEPVSAELERLRSLLADPVGPRGSTASQDQQRQQGSNARQDERILSSGASTENDNPPAAGPAVTTPPEIF